MSDLARPHQGLFRGRVETFVDSHLLLWELAMGGLAIVYLIIGVLVDTGSHVPTEALTALGLFFLLEFTARLMDSSNRTRYVRRHWLDLVSCIPLIGGTRSLRLLRLLRFGAAARTFSLAEVHASLRQRGRSSVWFVLPFLLIAWFTAAAAYWELEHDISPTLHTFGDALYWVFMTTVTIGYADVRPVTSEGRILSGLLIFLGIGLIGFLSSRLTAHLLDVHDNHHELHTERLMTLEDRLANIEGLLTEIAANQNRAATPPRRPVARRDGPPETPEQNPIS